MSHYFAWLDFRSTSCESSRIVKYLRRIDSVKLSVLVENGYCHVGSIKIENKSQIKFIAKQIFVLKRWYNTDSKQQTAVSVRTSKFVRK